MNDEQSPNQPPEYFEPDLFTAGSQESPPADDSSEPENSQVTDMSPPGPGEICPRCKKRRCPVCGG